MNLDRIQHWIDQGRLTSSPEKPITARELLLSGCIHDVHDGIKVLGDVCIPFYVYVSLNKTSLQGLQDFHTPIYITPSRASKSAIKAIEDQGGKVVCKYYNDLALRDCVKGRTDRVEAAPTRREDIGALLCFVLFSSMFTDFNFSLYPIYSLVRQRPQQRIHVPNHDRSTWKPAFRGLEVEITISTTRCMEEAGIRCTSEIIVQTTSTFFPPSAWRRVNIHPVW